MARNAPRPPASLPYVSDEPPLQHGQAPSLTTHPSLIAQMVARKRAEAEMQGLRERLAQRQHEHRISSSPGAQLAHELNAQVAHADLKYTQPRTAPPPLPGRSVPSIPPLKVTPPIVFNAQSPAPRQPPIGASADASPSAQDIATPVYNARPPSAHTPTADSISTPATDDSVKPAARNESRRLSNGSDSLFGSPFSSPIVEFLEKATDSAGLREALEPNEVMSRSVSTAVETPAQPGNTADAAEPTSSEGTSGRQAPSDIPPLFSEKPFNTQSQARTPQPLPPQTQSFPAQQYTPANTSMPTSGHTYQAQQQQPGGRPQLAPRQVPAPRPVPYYPQQAGMPGYYRVELNPNWAGNGNTFIATPSNMPLPGTFPPMYDPQGSQGGMRFVNYAAQPGNYIVPQPGLPPAPGPLHTYGTTVAAAAVQRQGHQATNAGYLTAADLVAGINLKFKHATQNGFSVPKR